MSIRSMRATSTARRMTVAVNQYRRHTAHQTLIAQMLARIVHRRGIHEPAHAHLDDIQWRVDRDAQFNVLAAVESPAASPDG